MSSMEGVSGVGESLWQMGEGDDGYRLTDEARKALQVPPIAYPDGMVPAEVVVACCPEGLAPVLAPGSAVPMASLLSLISDSFGDALQACAGCDHRQCDGCQQLTGTVVNAGTV